MGETIQLTTSADALALFGTHDRYLRMVREALGVKVAARDDRITLEGEREAVERGRRVFGLLEQLLAEQGSLTPGEVQNVVQAVGRDTDAISRDRIPVMGGTRFIRPKTDGQLRYIKAIRSHEMVFCTGPAGTGKTYLAVAMALDLLNQGKCKKIVLARPAVEAGERLGFLPGDMQAKVNPYLRPLLDALHDMMAYDQIRRYMDNDLVEIVPLAFMRGRTLNEAAIILDEAQNTTVAQMKMFLTRMGAGSHVVATGDVTQVDLPADTGSGLLDACRRLGSIKGIEVVRLSQSDIVRHPLVQRVVEAYEDGQDG